MTSPICFIDIETTGVHPGRRAWEIAMIRRDDDRERETLLQIIDVDLSNADPFGLKVGRFYERHVNYAEKWDQATVVMTESEATQTVEQATRGTHLVGAVPNFDAETLDGMLRRHRLIPAWHYHLIDVEALALGWLHGIQREALEWGNVTPKVLQRAGVADEVGLPWDSSQLSRAVGVNPEDFEKHTALGDAKWARAIYDAVTGGQR